MAATIKVMLVDDHAIVLEGYRRLIEKVDGLEVVAEACDSATAYQRFKDVNPDVMVVDISMPGRGGIDLIRQVRLRDPMARIVVFTMHQNAAFAIQAFQAGAKAYITKSSKPSLLLHAIREVFQGRKAISPDVSEELALASVEVDEKALASLSPREFEILRQILDARSTAEIATALNLSPKTIANYHCMIRQKLGVGSDVELIYYGLRNGLVAVPMPA